MFANLQDRDRSVKKARDGRGLEFIREIPDKAMDQILTYNKEDLAATCAVLRWLKGKAV